MDRKRALVLTIGLTLILGFATSSTSESVEGNEEIDVPDLAEILSKDDETLSSPNATKDTNHDSTALDITESSVCTCEQAGKQGEPIKQGTDQDLVEENLVIEKKSGKSFDVITITIPNGVKKQKAEALKASAKAPETIALDEDIEEDVKEEEDVVKAKPEEKSATTKVEEEPEANENTKINRKTKEEKVKSDKKSSKSSEKKRTKRTTGRRHGKKGKGKSKGKRR